MTDFKPYEPSFEPGDELRSVDENAVTEPDKASPKEGSMKFLVFLMIVCWPAAVYYAITREFKH